MNSTTYSVHFQRIQLIFAESQTVGSLFSQIALQLIEWQKANSIYFWYIDPSKDSPAPIIDGYFSSSVRPEKIQSIKKKMDQLKFDVRRFEINLSNRQVDEDAWMCKMASLTLKEVVEDINKNNLIELTDEVLSRGKVLNIPLVSDNKIVGMMTLVSAHDILPEVIEVSSFIEHRTEIFMSHQNQKRANRQKEMLFRLASDRFFEGVIVEDEQGRAILVNQKFCELFSYPYNSRFLEDQSFRAVEELVASEAKFPTQILEWMNLCHIRVLPFKGQIIQLKSGNWIECSYLPMTESALTLSLWTFKDITQTKLQSDQQSKLTQLLEEGQKIGHFGSWEYEIASQKVVWSKELYEIFGLKSIESAITFAQYSALIHPEDYESFSASVKRAVERGEGYLQRYRIITPDGIIRFIEGRGRPQYSPEGKVISLMGTAQDITERVFLEEELIRSKELALRASVAKSSFLANLTHEIRTPMNGIIGLADISLSEANTEPLRQSIQMIKVAGESLLQILNDILDFSKTEAGKSISHLSEISYRDFILTTLRSFVGIGHNKRLFFSYKLSGDMPEAVFTDENKLRQILLNLIGNAFKFTDSGYVHVRFDASEADERLRITVEDSGNGISEGHLKTIFEPFEQAHETQTKQHSGTGLGLSIVRGLAQVLNGDVSVVSQLGQGSKFVVNLPMKFVSRTHSTAPSKARQIYFISDRKEVHQLIARQIEQINSTRAIPVRAHYSSVRSIDASTIELLGSEDILIIDMFESEHQAHQILDLIAQKGTVSPQRFFTGCDGETAQRFKAIGLTQLPVPFSLEFMLSEGELSADLNYDESKNTAASEKLSMRVLVAEDNLINQKVIEAQLKKLGVDIALVPNGFECLRAVEENDFDIILMDCHMPIMDGYDATQSIRKMSDPRKNSIPIVALTALVHDEDLARCYSVGMNGALSKPIAILKLQEALKKHGQNSQIAQKEVEN